MDEMEDSSNSDSSEDVDQISELHCKESESKLSDNKYMYESHIQSVDLYEKLADFNSLRAAYQRFHECFPLTPKLWSNWIKNEMKCATSEEDKNNILKLFDLAVTDYLSVNLWQSYAEYTMEVGSSEQTREILEKALNHAGLHANDSSLLWDYLREIELANFATAPKETEAWKQQATRVVKIFQRQLSVPLMGMENTYAEWQEWKKSLPSNFIFDSQPIEWGYQKALKDLQSYKPFEEELLTAQDDNNIFEIYKKYISIVKDPPTIICLYERAVSQLSSNPMLWLDYCKYVYKLEEIVLKVSERSSRNCSWSEELWVMKLRILENLKRNEIEVMSSFEQGLSNIAPSPGVQLWFTYIEFAKRNIDNEEKLNKLLEKAADVCGDSDSNYSFRRFQARSLAKKGNIKEAISVWNKIIGINQNKGNLMFWLEFISLVKQYGNINQMRSLYRRALNSCKNWAHYIAEEWLLFEREFGTLSSVVECTEKCSGIKENYHETAQQQNNHQEVDNDTKRGQKRKSNHEPQNPERNYKKLKQEPQKNIEKDPTKTVFVSNIDLRVDENTLKTMFPSAVNIEVCRDKKGKSKCFGYIQFSMEEEVLTALSRDREVLNGRPIFISNCKPDKNERKSIFKYSTEKEENKLFVRGLPKTLTKDEVMDVFKPYGAIDARIVLEKNGQSKGLAYIEFSNTESTKKALSATDHMKIGVNIISVAVSAPPPKKTTERHALEPVRNSRSRLQVPFIPRSLQVKNDQPLNEKKKVDALKSNNEFRKLFLNM